MTGRVDETGESGDWSARNAEIKTKKAALGEVIAGQRDHSTTLDHDALPGQGNATEASLLKSTLV